MDRSIIRVQVIARDIRFGNRLLCTECGNPQWLWQLSGGRVECCKRGGNRFGLLSGTSMARTRFSSMPVRKFVHSEQRQSLTATVSLG